MPWNLKYFEGVKGRVRRVKSVRGRAKPQMIRKVAKRSLERPAISGVRR